MLQCFLLTNCLTQVRKIIFYKPSYQKENGAHIFWAKILMYKMFMAACCFLSHCMFTGLIEAHMILQSLVGVITVFLKM